jgi:hypothetical protein
MVNSVIYRGLYLIHITGSGNTNIVIGLKQEECGNILKPHYQHRNRNDFIMYLSEWMRKECIPFESALKVIECIAADDEEILLVYYIFSSYYYIDMTITVKVTKSPILHSVLLIRRMISRG